MNKEVFILKMQKEGWEFLGKPDVGSEESSAPIDWKNRAQQNQFKRGMCLTFATDQEIDDLAEEQFDIWFDDHAGVYYFKNDWKKKFKGSEFLIPVVEKEIELREKFAREDILIRLQMIRDSDKSLNELIDYIEQNIKQDEKVD